MREVFAVNASLLADRRCTAYQAICGFRATSRCFVSVYIPLGQFGELVSVIPVLAERTLRNSFSDLWVRAYSYAGAALLFYIAFFVPDQLADV